MKVIYRLIVALGLVGLAACQPVNPPVTNLPAVTSPAQPEPSATEAPRSTAVVSPSPAPTAAPLPAPTETLAPLKLADTLLSFSGTAAAVSEEFILSTDGAVRVSWNYTGRGHFAVWLVNVDDELDDPIYDRQLVVDVNDSHRGAADFELIAGNYTLEVEEAAGPWQIMAGLQP